MAAPTTTYRMWKRLAERPGGTRLFSAAAMVRVPYFASIVPHVVRMEPGFAEVTLPKWFFVKNVEVMSPLASLIEGSVQGAPDLSSDEPSRTEKHFGRSKAIVLSRRISA